MSIIPASEANFALTIPLVIAGGGACGLTAALAAHDGGVEMVVLERDHTPMGSSSMSLGTLCASGSADQARVGIEDNADLFAADVMAKTHGQTDPAIARLVGAESGPAVDWLTETHGVPLRLDPNWPPAFGHTRARMHATPGRSGSDLMALLVAACDRAEIPILTDALLTDIFADGDRVVGVRYRRPDGGIEDIGCEALILATCGFSGNHAMIAEHIPDMAEARHFGWEGNQGDGINLGAALGGALADMDSYQGLGLLAEPAGIDVNPRFVVEGGVQVNRDGHRFSNEVEDVSGQGARVIRQPGGVAWVIYDQRIHDSCEDLPQYRALREVGGVRTADTLAALAEAAGIDQTGLQETMASIRIGETDGFGRTITGPELAPPYYAIKVVGALFHTQGGLVIGTDARVRKADGSTLPNLFAGGGAARGISGRGPSGYLPGAGLCTAITLGRVAGREAARLLKGDR